MKTKQDYYRYKTLSNLKQQQAYFKRLKENKTSTYKRAIVLNTKTISEPSFKEKYYNFIKSDYWKKRSKILKFKKRCVICKSKIHLNVHHISYEGVFTSKPEKEGHLVILCRTHHQEFHALYGVKHDMLKEWKEYLTNKGLPYNEQTSV